MSSCTTFYSEKRFAVRDEMVGIANTNTMVFAHVAAARGNGVRSWERAKYETDQRKQRDYEFFENKKKIQKMKKSNEPTIQQLEKEKQQKKFEQEQKLVEKLLKEIENPFAGFVPSEGNDGW
jgi:hypothetical protein